MEPGGDRRGQGPVVLTRVRAVAAAGRFVGGGLVHAYATFHAAGPDVIGLCGVVVRADMAAATSDEITCSGCTNPLDGDMFTDRLHDKIPDSGAEGSSR